jgi:hypothetical protein
MVSKGNWELFSAKNTSGGGGRSVLRANPKPGGGQGKLGRAEPLPDTTRGTLRVVPAAAVVVEGHGVLGGRAPR